MHPRYKTAAEPAPVDKSAVKDEKAHRFPGLALPNNSSWMEEGEKRDSKVATDIMSEFESMLETAKQDSRKRSRSRSRSPTRRRDRSRSPDNRRYGRDRDRDRRGRSRSRSPNGRGDRSRSSIDDAPILYKIYTGRVTNTKPFGAFVTLDGVRGKVEGMVHIGMLSAGRVNEVSDVVKRNEVVKVKVMSVTSTRLSLSMKD
ncbi:DEAH-box ATP-dependent RNA helicase prp22, partial [Haplosporangium bisporale]